MMGLSASIPVRQALTSTMVMLVAIALIAIAARVVVRNEQRAALLETIDTDIAGLVDGMAVGGPGEVARRIADRSALSGPSAASYLLLDARGRRVAGDLSPSGMLDATRSTSGDVTTAQGLALARATRLRGGYTLMVASSLAPTEAVVGRLTRVFLVAALPAALVSLAAGGLVARRIGVRVARLDSTLADFARGDHAARSDEHAGGDELYRLAAKIDDHLAHTQMLIETQRQIGENIAHELRTPLGHLDARLLHALDACGDAAPADELHGAREDIRSIVSLFDALLDLALAETLDRPTEVTFDLSERLAELADLYDASAEEAGLAFTHRIAPAVTMPGEPMAMTRAVANLLDNAFKFTAPGDHVRLSLEPGPRIVVEDDGPGVGDAERDRVFERFQRARGAGRGHGLGLALVKVIAARHGLVARLENAAPGARFVIAPAAAA